MRPSTGQAMVPRAVLNGWKFVAMAHNTVRGAAGCSIEDYDPATGGIDPIGLAGERVAAAAEEDGGKKRLPCGKAL